jgi:adenosine/AMP kinase
MGSSAIAELLSVYSSRTLLQKVGLVTTQKLEKIDPKYGLSGALMGVHDGTVPQRIRSDAAKESRRRSLLRRDSRRRRRDSRSG